jgi:hypothetical protein
MAISTYLDRQVRDIQRKPPLQCSFMMAGEFQAGLRNDDMVRLECGVLRQEESPSFLHDFNERVENTWLRKDFPGKPCVVMLKRLAEDDNCSREDRSKLALLFSSLGCNCLSRPRPLNDAVQRTCTRIEVVSSNNGEKVRVRSIHRKAGQDSDAVAVLRSEPRQTSTLT